MYKKQEEAQLRKKFWTSLGLYMSPVNGAGGETVNWLNYNTGKKHIHFRVDVDRDSASLSIELSHPDLREQESAYRAFEQLKEIFTSTAGTGWTWKFQTQDDTGQKLSTISISLSRVSIYRESDWPDIISFLKPGLVGLDQFWEQVKDGFDIS